MKSQNLPSENCIRLHQSTASIVRHRANSNWTNSFVKMVGAYSSPHWTHPLSREIYLTELSFSTIRVPKSTSTVSHFEKEEFWPFLLFAICWVLSHWNLGEGDERSDCMHWSIQLICVRLSKMQRTKSNDCLVEFNIHVWSAHQLGGCCWENSC